MKKRLTQRTFLKRKRKHGFRRRMRDKKGRAVLKRRRQKSHRSISA